MSERKHYVWVVDDEPSSIEAALATERMEGVTVKKLIHKTQLDVVMRSARVIVMNPAQAGRNQHGQEALNPFFVIAKYHEYAQEIIDKNTAPYMGWKPATLIGCDPYNNRSTRHQTHIFSALHSLESIPEAIRQDLAQRAESEAYAVENTLEFGVKNPLEHLSPFWWKDAVITKPPEMLEAAQPVRQMSAIELRLKMMEDARKAEKKPQQSSIPPMAAIVGSMSEELRVAFEKACTRRDARGWAMP